MFVNRYQNADIAPAQVSLNVLRLQQIAQQNTNVAQLQTRANNLSVADALIEKVQSDSLKKMASVIRNDTSIQNQLRTLMLLVESYDGPSSDELQALMQTLQSRITTAREQAELERLAKKDNLVLKLVQRRERQEEKDKKLEAKKAAGRFRFQMSAE